MHLVTTDRNHSAQARTRSAPSRHADINVGGLFRRLLTMSVTKWRRRKMIATLEAMDTRLLRDIGIERCDIESVVDGFDHRELRMVPLALPHKAVSVDQAMRQAA